MVVGASVLCPPATSRAFADVFYLHVDDHVAWQGIYETLAASTI